jgi:hypothetical protein
MAGLEAEVESGYGLDVQPMEDRELAQWLEQEKDTSIGNDNSEISDQRARSMERYLGEPYGNEVNGRSQVVSRDVTDAVEWAMPQLMDVFFGGDTTVELDPTGAEDADAARLETAYLNYLFLRQNNGFIEGYQFIKDALLQTDGIIKVWSEDETKEYYETYVGLTQAELQALLITGDKEPVEKSDYETVVEVPTPEGPQPMPVVLSDVKLRCSRTERKVRVCAVPPEEFLVSKRTRTNLQETPYCNHTAEYTRSELRELMESIGSDLDPDEIFERYQGEARISSSPERLARHAHDGTDPDTFFSNNSDLVWVNEEYARVDANGDGYDELLKVIRVGTEVLWKEEVEIIPFAHAQAILLSHKWNGLSLASLVEDIAQIKTALQRSHLDNIYRQNNGRVAVLEGQVEMDDLLTSRPGGVVREYVSGAVRPLQEPPLSPQAFDLLAYFDQIRDERTGISKLSQGLDPNALSSNVASSAVGQVMSAAQQRIKLMARVLAEGFRQVFWLLHEVSRREMDSLERFEFNGQSIEVNPGRFLERKDYTVRVGLGNIERDADLQRLGLIAQDMQLIASQGGMGRILQEGNVYELAVARARAAGFKNFNSFYTDPRQLPPPEQQPSEAEIEAQVLQATHQHEQMLRQMEIESRERIEAAKLEMKAEELRLKDKELEMEAELERTQGRGVSLG